MRSVDSCGTSNPSLLPPQAPILQQAISERTHGVRSSALHAASLRAGLRSTGAQHPAAEQSCSSRACVAPRRQEERTLRQYSVLLIVFAPEHLQLSAGEPYACERLHEHMQALPAAASCPDAGGSAHAGSQCRAAAHASS